MGVFFTQVMAFVPYTRSGYGYPYAGYGYGYGGYGHPGAFGYGPSLEEVKKVREAEEKAFKAAEDRAKELWRPRRSNTMTSAPPKRRPSMTPSPRRRSSTRRSVILPSSLGLPHSPTAMLATD